MDDRFSAKHDLAFHALLAFLTRIPSVRTNASAYRGFSSGRTPDGRWWVKLVIAIEHPLAWSAVQELGHVLNLVSTDERLPTVFKPVSPPPYLNGGPTEFLSWVIECHEATFTPDDAAKWLESRLPKPVEDPTQWPTS